MKKIGIVILNYLNYQDTIECIESLKQQTNQCFEIIIVDNDSQNGSFEKLCERYGKKNGISIIETGKNLGYAKGNNAGIKFAKQNLGLKNILIVNNDVIFTDVNYINFLINFDIGKKVGAVGTKIIGADGLNQNPVYTPITRKRLLKDAIYFTLEKWNILRFYTGLKSKIKPAAVIQSNENSTKNMENKSYFLHGSAILLTENFLNEIEGFFPETFLYYEENILAIMMEKLNLKMVYANGAEIYHKEDQSSALSFGNSHKVFNKYLVQSIWIALKVKLSSLQQIKKTVNKS
ncbi:glycosyltransferase [Carnobacterium mobile]|uniref:glycosyltransferase n=1 Tax=Carnobacterium mobile TaxID=2750 RepID=UPI0005516B39|nr:glycosyltransferase family 2 protein [Carnobacterium mobile]